jgi:hypothetical protein
VTGAVDVGVVAVLGLVLEMGGRNGDSTLALFGSLVDGAVLEELGKALFGLSFGDGSCEGSFAMIDVANCTCGKDEVRIELI